MLSDSNTSLGSTNSILSNGYQVNSEKIILAKKIREYNRKTTPVHHIHIKSVRNNCEMTLYGNECHNTYMYCYVLRI